MNILQIQHNFYPRQSSGIEVYAHEVAKHLISRGNNVYIIVPQLLSIDQTKKITIDGIKMFFIPKKKIGNNFLKKIIKENEIDLIHIHHLANIPKKIIKQVRRLNKPYVISLHDYWYVCPRAKAICAGNTKKCALECCSKNTNNFLDKLRYFKSIIFLKMRKKYFINILNNANFILPNSYYTEHFYRKLVSQQKMLVHYPGINMKYFDEIKKIQRKQDNFIKIGYIGSLSKEKGIILLLDTFKKISLKKNIRLYIYGHGKIMTEKFIKESASNDKRILFFGKYDHKDIKNILSSIDILIVPSIWEEAYGLVILEALAANVTIIASDTGGISERIIDGYNGFLFNKGDVTHLKEKIEYVSNNYSTIQKSLNFKMSQVDIKKDIEKLLKVYNYIIKSQNCDFFNYKFDEDIKLISSFLNKDFKTIREKLFVDFLNPGFDIKKSWNKFAPKNKEEIQKYYSSTESFIISLTAIYKTYDRFIWRKKAVEIFLKFNVNTILDFGGGVGYDTEYFFKFFGATLYELPSLTAKFAKFRFKRLNLDIPVITSLKEELFDAIYCTEVLEHLVDPQQTLKLFHKYLKKNGVLIVTHSFELVGEEYPSHLQQKAELIKNFILIVENFGFKFLNHEKVPGNKFYIFKKL